jgi:quinohemoprotein ethanol dehydrogenase
MGKDTKMIVCARLRQPARVAVPDMVIACVLGLLLSGGHSLAADAEHVSKGIGRVDQSRLNHTEREPENWMTHGGSYDEQRFSRLQQIDTGNVTNLGLAWSHTFDTNRGQEATPLVVDGVMYTSTAWSKVFALDARTGREIWKFDPQVPGNSAVYGCCDVVNRGVAVWKGKVFVGTLDGRLIAVNAANGKPLWSVATTDPSKPYTITGAPRVFKDKVIIGNGGAEFGVRGFVSAYDTQTGKLMWRFYTVPADPVKGPDGAASDSVMPMAAATWFGKAWIESGGGGTAWDSMVYDPELDQLYIGTGNGSPWSRVARSEGRGDNLFLASILALDPDTGAYRWHYQATPGDSFDFTSTAQITLATLTIDGKARKVLMQAPKNGIFYVIDRTTGKLISGKNFTQVTWTTGIDPQTGRPHFADNAYYDQGAKLILPSSFGAHSWQPMSYSPQTGLVYLPVMERPAIYAQDPSYQFIEGRMNFAVAFALPGADAPKVSGALIAWDPIGQKEVWRVRQPESWNGGALSTAGKLVFAGNAHGEFSAFSAADGTKLWTFKQQAGIIAGPISYAVAGEQYVAVISGYGGGVPLMIRDENRPQQAQPPGRMLAFKLGGQAKLADVDLTLPAANPPDDQFAPKQIGVGAMRFYQHCIFCHGGTVLPDLRRSAALREKDAWRQIVIGGALAPNGMVSFAKWIKPEDAEDIRAYVASEAKQLEAAEAAGSAVRK